MRVFLLDGERFRLRVPALEPEVPIVKIADFGLEPLDLRLETPDLLGEKLDGALLPRPGPAARRAPAARMSLQRAGRERSALAAKPDRSRRPFLGASSAACALPFRRKNRGIGKGNAILPTNDAAISPASPFFAYVYLIAEQIPDSGNGAKYPKRELGKWPALSSYSWYQEK